MYKYHYLTILICLLTAGCGFKLKQDWAINQANNRVVLSSGEQHLPMFRTLRQGLLSRGVIVATDGIDMPQINIINESLERRLLSLFSSGQVAEYDLVFKVRYAIQLYQQEAQLFEFQETRQYQDDPDRALAKSKERAVILEEMRTTASDEIFRKYLNLSNTVVSETVAGDTVANDPMVTHANIQ